MSTSSGNGGAQGARRPDGNSNGSNNGNGGASRPDGGTAGPDDDGVARYAAEVRSELSDLTPEQSADLLEDLEDHLRELSADVGELGDLWTYLGAPADYASELRMSAGLPPRQESDTPDPARPPHRSFIRRVEDRFARWQNAVIGTRAGAAVVDFLPSLRPAWWVVRAWAAVQVLAWLTTGGSRNLVTLVPEPGNSYLLGLVLLAAAIPASVWFARRPPLAGRRGTAFALLQGFLAVFTLAALLPQGSDYGSQRVFPNDFADSTPGLVDNGSPVTNLFVYDQTGKLIDGAYVYDQNGNPIQVGGFGGADGSIYGGPAPYQSGGDGIFEAQQWLDGQGFTVVNRYPQHEARVVYPADGGPELVGVPWITVQVPQGVHSVPLVGNGWSPGAADGTTSGPSDSPSAGPTTAASSGSAAPVTGPTTASTQPGASPAHGPSATPTPVPTPSAPATTR